MLYAIGISKISFRFKNQIFSSSNTPIKSGTSWMGWVCLVLELHWEDLLPTGLPRIVLGDSRHEMSRRLKLNMKCFTWGVEIMWDTLSKGYLGCEKLYIFLKGPHIHAKYYLIYLCSPLICVGWKALDPWRILSYNLTQVSDWLTGSWQ